MGNPSGGGGTLVLICGPPAVGKMAVGLELSAQTGFPLFHNHVSIEAVLTVFEFGTPQFNRLVGGFRDQMFREVASSDLPGLIFTMMWGFGLPSELAHVEKVKSIFEAQGGSVVFAELEADLATRLERNASELRLSAKPSKRDVAASRARLLAADEKYQLNSDDDFPFDAHLKIDNSNLEAAAVAEMIATHFGLPRQTRAEP